MTLLRITNPLPACDLAINVCVSPEENRLGCHFWWWVTFITMLFGLLWLHFGLSSVILSEIEF